jgi:hypothetical protein
MKKRALLVTIAVVLVGAGVYAGVYLATRPSGPAVELALKSHDVGSDWKWDKLVTYDEGRGITQVFFKTVDLDEDRKLLMSIYQRINIYTTVEAALECGDFETRREYAEPLELPFWDESYNEGYGIWGLALRKSNIVVVLTYEEYYLLRNRDPFRDPWTGEFSILEATNLTKEEVLQTRGVERLFYDLAEIIQGKIVETGGG